MSWNDIIARTPDDIRYRQLTGVVLDSLYLDKGLRVPPNYKGFMVSFVQYLKKRRDKENINLWDIIILLTEQPQLARFILEHKFDSFMRALRQGAQSEYNKERLFITGYYDNYYELRNTMRALIKTRKNVFIRADKQLMRTVFKKYPYLKDAAHLQHVTTQLDRVTFAFYLTQDGIKETYPCA